MNARATRRGSAAVRTATNISHPPPDADLDPPAPITVVTASSFARQVLHRCGGAFGLAAAVTPTVAFVAANAVAGLTTALVVLGASASAVFGVRLLRREPLRAAAVGVAVAAAYALAAALAGQARGFFLLPTLMPAVLAVVCVATVAIRRPVTGLLFNRAVGGPPGWRRNRRLRRVYSRSTLAAALVNAVNFVVQAVLFLDDRPAALAAAHLTIWPVFAALVTATLLAARRAITDTARTAPEIT